jgi:hypothetical protein
MGRPERRQDGGGPSGLRSGSGGEQAVGGPLPRLPRDVRRDGQQDLMCVAFLPFPRFLLADPPLSVDTLSCTLREHLDNPENLLPIDGSEPWAVSSWVDN